MSTDPSNQSNNLSEDLTKWKIFPRNLTAHADYLVKGNPASSRPESTVGNCFPGLELDDRNLEKKFFPGLVFEFHRTDGAILYSLTSESTAAQSGLTDGDLIATDSRGRIQRILYLWAIYGLMGSSKAGNKPEFISCSGMGGPELWRVVHDLRPGRIIIMVGPRPSIIAPPFELGTPRQAFEPPLDEAKTLIEFLQKHYESGQSAIFRDLSSANSPLRYAFFVDNLEPYLDDQGVINVDLYPPGDLTRSMCAPWQYDYTDCGCFYWAANKPDMVAGAQLDENNELKFPYLNYQRKERGSEIVLPREDIPDPEGSERETEIKHGEMFDAWNDILPVVLNDRESEHFIPPEAAHPKKIMNRQEVIDELKYLATVEHALCVEYLYAHYSLNAPEELPKDPAPKDETRRIFAAAHEIFTIAVDEMRHLHLVNEALDILGIPASLGRAEIIGRWTFKRPFSLKPLDHKQLEWFIEVEKPSRAIDETQGVDGMYVQLHRSIGMQPNEFPHSERLVHLIKLIIDEGGDHYHRFISVRHHLGRIPRRTYLRELKDAPLGSDLTTLQDLSDKHYATVLGILAQRFSLGDKAGGILIKNAIKEMFNLHDTNHILASEGVRPRFTLPSIVPSQSLASAEASHAHVDEMSNVLNNALASIMEKGGEQKRMFAANQQRVTKELFELMHKLIKEDKGK